MRPFFSLPEVKLGPADYYIPPVADEIIKYLLKIQDLGPPIHNGKEDNPKGYLHLCKLEQTIHYHHGIAFPLHVYYNPHPLPVRFVPNIGYLLYFFLLYQFSYAFSKFCLVYLIRYLRYDNPSLTFTDRLHECPGPYLYNPPPYLICIHDALAAKYKSCGWRIRRLNHFH